MTGVAIDYDPLKAKLGRLVARNPFMRRLFYTALGLLFLRQWHVRKELRRIAMASAPDARGKRSGDARAIREILDAGSGFGQYAYLMTKFFPSAHITALDVKTEQIDDCNFFAKARGIAGLDFAFGDLTQYRQDDRFDLALSVDVMEHIEDDRAVYQNIFAALRSGGLFVVATPSTTQTSGAGEIHSVIGEHVREGYTEAEFREKINAAGFTIEKLNYTYGPIWGRAAWWILQRIPMRLLTLSRLLAVFVIPWMIVLYPVAACCMWMDTLAHNHSGGGWIMVARKP
jgi:2-polyprenyl-3-methyl-5-hydroxy-6-metoxy-1,4-benzoquinol methylase